MIPHVMLKMSLDKLFYADMFTRSLDACGDSPFHLSLIVTDVQSSVERLGTDGILTEISSSYPYLFRKAEITISLESHSSHPPLRWLLEPKSEVSLILDCDMLAFSSIRPAVEICAREQAICGVLAQRAHVGLGEWRRLFGLCGAPWNEDSLVRTWDGRPSPYYINYGVVVVPARYHRLIGEALPAIVRTVQGNTSLPFFTAQIALAIAFAKCGVPTRTLPLRFNYPDQPCYDFSAPEEFEKIVFYHMLELKNQLKDLAMVRKFLGGHGVSPSHERARRVLEKSFGLQRAPVYL